MKFLNRQNIGLTNWSSKRRLIICPSERSLGATNLSLRAQWDAERGMENFCRWLFCCCCQNGWLSQRGVHRKTDRPPYTLGPRHPTPTPSNETHNPQPHCHFKCGQTLLSLKPYLCITWSEGCKSFFFFLRKTSETLHFEIEVAASRGRFLSLEFTNLFLKNWT